MLRTLRSGLTVLVVLGLATSAHVLGGGQAPGAVGLGVIGLALAGPVWWAAGRRLGTGPLAALLGAAQVFVHLSLMAMAPTSGGSATVHVHGGLPPGMATGLPDAAAPMAMHHGLGGTMLLAHTVATVVTALVLARGEAALWHVRPGAAATPARRGPPPRRRGPAGRRVPGAAARHPVPAPARRPGSPAARLLTRTSPRGSGVAATPDTRVPPVRRAPFPRRHAVHHTITATRRLAATAALAALAAGLTGCGTTADASGDGATASSGPALTLDDGWVKAVDDAPSPDASASTPPTPGPTSSSGAMGGMDMSGPMTAMFGTLHNGSSQQVTISAGSSPAAGMVQLHETVKNASGSTQMQEKKGGFVLPPGGDLTLQPGGDHVMLMDLTGSLRNGDRTSVTLQTSAGPVTFTVPVRAFTGAQESYAPTPSS